MKRGRQRERCGAKQRAKESEREMKYRRTATQPDRPVAQPAHVYLALLLRFFEVLIDELPRAFAEAPNDRVRERLFKNSYDYPSDVADAGNDSLSDAVTQVANKNLQK